MTTVNGITVGRTGVSTADAAGSSPASARLLGHRDGFERTSTSHDGVPVADAQRARATAASAARQTAAVEHATTAVRTAQSAMASTAGMSRDEAKAQVVAIYSAAFPGIGFTEYELRDAIRMLQTGKVTPDELRARVEEGARLVNDPNAMANEAAKFAADSEHFTGDLEVYKQNRPYYCSVITQQLRLERLAALMDAGYLPQGKFNIVGAFSYGTVDGWVAPGQHMSSLFAGAGSGGQQSLAGGARVDPDAEKEATLQRLETLERELEKDSVHDRGSLLSRGALSSSLARSLERYRSTARSSGNEVEGRGEDDKSSGMKKQIRALKSRHLTLGERIGGPTLIRGAASNTAAPAATTSAFGWDTNNQVSLQGATSSSLLEASSELTAARKTGSPVMLDLNHDGKLGVSGISTAKERTDGITNATADFDLDGNGSKEHIEWMTGDGDGMLVDDRDGGATAAMQAGGEIDGKRLFGDEGGKYTNGYDKLAKLDADHDGRLSGHELDGLRSWIDDGDAKLETGELKTMVELGITSINLKMELTANDRGEQLMRSTFTQNGVEHVSEDVWFGIDHGLPNLHATAATVGQRATSDERAHMRRRLDSTLALLDDMARRLETTHGIARLGDQARLRIGQDVRA